MSLGNWSGVRLCGAKAARYSISHIGKSRPARLAPVRLAFLQNFSKQKKSILSQKITVFLVASGWLVAGPKQRNAHHSKIKAAGWIMAGLGVTQHRLLRYTLLTDKPGGFGNRQITLRVNDVPDRRTMGSFADRFHSQIERVSVKKVKLHGIN